MILPDMVNGYAILVDHVLQYGHEVSPRGQRTLEVENMQFTLLDPTKSVPVGVGRNPSLRLGAAETAQLISGRSRPSQLIAIAPNFANFVENGVQRGAYGPRLAPQWDRIIKSLGDDPDSRQAVGVIFRAGEQMDSKDVPCTIGLNWRIRDGKLNATTWMRSNDVFWGVPYDVWMFTALQRALAWALKVEVGTYTHNAASFHAYIDRDGEAFAKLRLYDGKTPQPPGPVPSLAEGRLGNPLFRWSVAQSWMLDAVLGRTLFEKGVPDAPRWYAEILR